MIRERLNSVSLAPRHSASIRLEIPKASAKRYVPAVYRAAIYAAIGDKDACIEWANKAYEQRSDYMIYLKTEPWADALRSDPRMQSLLQKIERGR